MQEQVKTRGGHHDRVTFSGVGKCKGIYGAQETGNGAETWEKHQVSSNSAPAKVGIQNAGLSTAFSKAHACGFYPRMCWPRKNKQLMQFILRYTNRRLELMPLETLRLCNDRVQLKSVVNK